MRENSWKAIYLVLFIIAIGFFAGSHIGMGDGLVWSTAVQEDGSLIGSRPILNFENAVTVVDNLADNRIDLTIPGIFPAGRAKSDGGTVYYSTPGYGCTTFNYDTITANRLYYEPIFCTTAITVQKLSLQVQTAGAAGKKVRVGIYNCTTDLQPTSLILDAGEVAVDTTGQKIITVDLSLPPGLYLSCFVSDGTPILFEMESPSPAIYPSGHYPIQDFYDAFSYGVLPSTGQTWSSSTPMYNLHHRIFWGITP